MSYARSTFAIALLAAATWAHGQTTSPASGTSASKPAQPAAQTAPAPAGQSAPASPPRRALPQAKTAEEHQAYLAAVARPNPGEEEAAAKAFEAKFPASELRAPLYQDLMTKYQNANNADKTIEMGRKVIQLDPDNTVVLVMTANVLAERTRETDLDRDERYKEAMKYAQRGLDTVNAGLSIQAGTPPEKAEELKALVRSMALAAMGTVELNRRNDAAAEQHLRQAVQLNTVQPDAVTYLRLAIALDHQQKYAEALQAANKALELSPQGPMGDLARQERDRLTKLTAAATPPAKPVASPAPATPASPATATPTTPPSKPKGL